MTLPRLADLIALRLRSLLRKSSVERDLERELAFHLEQQTNENLARGLPPGDSYNAALRSFGGVTQIQEECRDMRSINQWETIVGDLRYAVRTLLKAPGFTIVIVLTLALSIGANSAIYSVIQGVLLKPLSYAQPDRLVRIYFQSDRQPKFPLNPNDFRDFRSRTRVFASMAGMVRHDAQLSGAGEPVRLNAFAVTAGYFQLLGFHPALGREFNADDEVENHGSSTILSDRLWRTRFASDPAIVGKVVTLNSHPYIVAGVMPPGVQHPGNNFRAVPDGETVDLWFPFTFDEPNDRGSHYMDTLGRLKPGISSQQANADMSAALNQFQILRPGQSGWRVYVVPLYQEMVGRSQTMLLVLLGAVGLLLLIACVNAANLLLARSSARVREIAVRSALGAARSRIIRQLLTESLVIALAGAALGTALAFGGVRLLVSFLPANFPRAAEIRLDSSVFAFTVIVGILTGLLFGLVPALAASRTDLQQGLREGGRSATGGGRQLHLRNLLVVGEMSLACVLLIGAGLLLHSFINLLNADPGFRPQQVLTASISVPYEHYKTGPQRIRFYRQLLSNLESLPGIEAAGVGSDLPWTGFDGNADGFGVEGRPDSYRDKTTARSHVASPGYFRALGLPLLHGRYFDAHDDAAAPPVLIVNESMARAYWPGEDAVGKRITFRGVPAEKDWLRIIGVVGNIRDQPESNVVRPAFWIAHAQQPDRSVSIVIRSTTDQAPLVLQLRQAVARLDPEIAIADLRVMNRIVHESVSNQRFALFLVGLFAALALVLATIGMYGVISYSVNQRMHEFGMRMALGARPWDLMRMIVGQGLKLSLIGAALGLFAAAGLTRVLATLLYGMAGSDYITFSAVALLAVCTAALACYLPARRATEADPMVLLRSE